MPNPNWKSSYYKYHPKPIVQKPAVVKEQNKIAG